MILTFANLIYTMSKSSYYANLEIEGIMESCINTSDFITSQSWGSYIKLNKRMGYLILLIAINQMSKWSIYILVPSPTTQWNSPLAPLLVSILICNPFIINLWWIKVFTQ